jgi:hypothetical protein
MQLAAGEAEEEFDADRGKDKAAQMLGRKGGKARASKLTAEQRAETAPLQPSVGLATISQLG